ncbi:MAG TPA: hypothetical protein VGR12_06025 [Solirubrobacteraceae bacterium]|nr:hypothetical protein [Solirubrobacteraceae bacterium]
MGGDEDTPSTEELRALQAEREEAERAMAEDAITPAGERTHERRAERARYLRAKLDEQADSERG